MATLIWQCPPQCFYFWPSTLRPHALPPPACVRHCPRSCWGTWEINWADLFTQQVLRLPSTHPGPICQLTSCSVEPWQQGIASPTRLHYACQMGWELDSNTHHGEGVERDWRGREGADGGKRRGKMMQREESNVFLFSFMLQVITF